MSSSSLNLYDTEDYYVYGNRGERGKMGFYTFIPKLVVLAYTLFEWGGSRCLSAMAGEGKSFKTWAALVGQYASITNICPSEQV